VILAISLSIGLSSANKLENWINPSIEGSIQQDALNSATRSAKYLGGTTTTTTSSAYTYCYTSAAAISTTCDRKKRSIDDSPIDDESQYPDMINPSSLIKEHQQELEEQENQGKRSVPITKLEELNQLTNVKVPRSRQSLAQPRLFLWGWGWTVTSTTYTKTLTITISSCTPSSSFSLSLCG